MSRTAIRTAMYWQMATVFAVSAGLDCISHFILGVFWKEPHAFTLALSADALAAIAAGFLALWWQKSIHYYVTLLTLHLQTRDILQHRVKDLLENIIAIAHKCEVNDCCHNAHKVREIAHYIDRRIEYANSPLMRADLEHEALNS